MDICCTTLLAPIADGKLDDANINSQSTQGLIGALHEKEWGSDFDIQRALDTYQCKHEENSMRAFDKYLSPRRLHFSDSTQIESILLFMDKQNKTVYNPRENCKDEGYMATHGWDNKNEEWS